jgi:hypothetical protein
VREIEFADPSQSFEWPNNLVHSRIATLLKPNRAQKLCKLDSIWTANDLTPSLRIPGLMLSP